MPKKNRNKGLMAAAVVAVLIVVVLVYSLTLGRSSSSVTSYTSVPSTQNNNSTSTHGTYNISILAQNETFTVNVDDIKSINFTIPQGSASANITGAYTSSPGMIDVAIFTQSQYTTFIQNHSPISSAQYYYGNTRGAVISAMPVPGQYALVFYNHGFVTQATVTVSSPIVVHYTH